MGELKMKRLTLRKSDLQRNFKIKWLPCWSFRYIYLLALLVIPVIAMFADRPIGELIEECIDYIFAKVVDDTKATK